MRLLVLGASGKTGRQLVGQALAADHEVTAFARRVVDVDAPGRLISVAADANDAEKIDEAVRGQDAVVCLLGTRAWSHTPVCSIATGHALAAMRRHGVRRFVCVSSFGVAESAEQVTWWSMRALFATVLRGVFEDRALQERLTRESDRDWVVVRPALLTDGPLTGRYGVAIDGSIGGGFVSRADVAHFLLRQCVDDAWLGQAPVIGPAPRPELSARAGAR